MIGRHSYLVLHKSEWERLGKKQPTKFKSHDKDAYLRSLIEQSQEWMKHWTDTVQGHVYQLEKQKKLEHDKLTQTVKQIHLKRKHENTAAAIKKARGLIFDDSCYGRQLHSALLESKTLEERDVQLKFQEQLRNKMKILQNNEPKATSLLSAEEMEANEMTVKIRNKHAAEEVSKFNKNMFNEQIRNKSQQKEEEKQERLENKRFVEEQQKLYTESEAIRSQLEKLAIEDCQNQSKNIKDFRKKNEKQDERLREVWEKYQDRVKCRERLVFNKMHNERYDTPQSQQIFKTLKNIKEKRKIQYDEFIQKGIERWLERSKKIEEREINSKASQRNKRRLMDEENKKLTELQIQTRAEESDKCVCCKQCILPKCEKARRKISPNNENANQKESLFLKPKHKHLDDLKKREKEPSPWNGLQSTHAQFSEQASNILKECRYKNTALKVIAQYKHLNCLDEKALPISY